jgi:hypothetical protein
VPSFAAPHFGTTSAGQDWRGDLAEDSASLNRVGDAPESYPVWPGTRPAGPPISKPTLQRFPYVIAFEKHERHVLVLAVAHAKRRPLYWLTRAEP